MSKSKDAVQETWLRYEGSPTQPRSAKAFLSTTVSRIAIDVLRSARVRRELYVGPWFPEPLLADPYQGPERSEELADSVSMAALLLLERLSPLERPQRLVTGHPRRADPDDPRGEQPRQARAHRSRGERLALFREVNQARQPTD